MLDEKGKPNIEKIRPILFAGNDTNYYALGNSLGLAFSIGKEFRPK